MELKHTKEKTKTHYGLAKPRMTAKVEKGKVQSREGHAYLRSNDPYRGSEGMSQALLE